MQKHAFKNNFSTRKSFKIDKAQLRLKIIEDTKSYLLSGKKIQIQPDSPNAKVAEFKIRELGSYSDSEQFYTIEESDDVIHNHLNEI
jgi:hypothetical protein